MIYFIALTIVFFFHLFLKMNWLMTGISVIFMLVLLPIHRKRYRAMQKQKKRFFEISVYMDTLLYAFVKDGKIESAMTSVSASLPEGNLKQVVDRAIGHMHMTFDETEVIRDALAMVEKEYPCKRLKDIHNFMSHVEFYGGDMERPVSLLLEDKSRWEKRTRENMQERRKMWIDIVLSVVVSLGICGVILYLPVMSVDISQNLIAQILTLIVLFLDECILLKGQSYLSPDWLTLDEVEEDRYYEQKMQDFQEYDAGRDRRLSWILGGISGVAAILCFLLVNQWVGLVMTGIFLVCVNQHRIGRNMARKSLVKGIQCAFPGWLMDLVLLLQSENVQVALQKSREQVPGILRKELERLLERLQMNPESSVPYHQFLKDFELPEIHSAMSMLFSLSIGNSGNGDRQISELIARNQEMLDHAQTIRMKDKNSGMYLLFLAPVVTASVKLVTDMAIFMLTFLTTMTI